MLGKIQKILILLFGGILLIAVTLVSVVTGFANKLK